MGKSVVKAIKPKTRKKSGGAPRKYTEIRNDLERQRTDLLHEAGLSLSQRPDNEALPDVSDQASVEFDQTFSLRLKEREQRLLRKITEAIQRIDAATYGTCERCGEQIPYKRLKARPVTTFCINCKTLQEEEERRHR